MSEREIQQDTEDTEGNMAFRRGVSGEPETEDVEGQIFRRVSDGTDESEDTEGQGTLKHVDSGEPETDDTEGNRKAFH